MSNPTVLSPYVSLMMNDTRPRIRLKRLSEAPREKLLDVIAELLSRIASPEKEGAGPLGHRGSYNPRPERVDESIDVPLSRCPRCGGPIES